MIKAKTTKKHSLRGIGKKEQGFTLVEMVILLSIMGMITGIISINSRAGERQYALKRSAQIVTQTVNEAITMSLGNKEHGGAVSQGGYGVEFKRTTNTLTIFADCNEDDINTTTGPSWATLCGESGNETAEFVSVRNLERGIVIENLFPKVSSVSPPINCPNTTICTRTVTFKPPEPGVTFYGRPSGPGGREITYNMVDDDGVADNEIVVRLGDGRGNTLDVYINRLGVTRIE